MVGVGKNEKQKFEQGKMSPCKVKPKEKQFMHDKVLSLCVPRLKSRAKEARLIMEVDNFKSGPILAVLIHFLYVVSFRFALECCLERETKIEPDLSQVRLITALNFFFVCEQYLGRHSRSFIRIRSFFRGTQREHSSKPLKHSIVKRILVFKR